jgi:hypothetical protein
MVWSDLCLDELMEIDTPAEVTRDSFKQWLLDIRCLWNYHIIFDHFETVDAIVCLGTFPPEYL